MVISRAAPLSVNALRRVRRGTSREGEHNAERANDTCQPYHAGAYPYRGGNKARFPVRPRPAISKMDIAGTHHRFGLVTSATLRIQSTRAGTHSGNATPRQEQRHKDKRFHPFCSDRPPRCPSQENSLRSNPNPLIPLRPSVQSSSLPSAVRKSGSGSRATSAQSPPDPSLPCYLMFKSSSLPSVQTLLRGRSRRCPRVT
jgi:hypothetical protein